MACGTWQEPRGFGDVMLNWYFCFSRLHGNPLPLHNVPGLRDHVPRLHPTPIHPQQQAAGQWGPGWGLQVTSGWCTPEPKAASLPTTFGWLPARHRLSWRHLRQQVEAFSLGDLLYHGLITWGLETRSGVIQCHFFVLAIPWPPCYPSFSQGSLESSGVLWGRPKWISQHYFDCKWQSTNRMSKSEKWDLPSYIIPKYNSNTLATWYKELTHWKDPDSGKDRGQEEKGVTEDEMVGWHHWINGHEFEYTPGDGEGQGSLTCCGVTELDTTWQLNKKQHKMAAGSWNCPCLTCNLPNLGFLPFEGNRTVKVKVDPSCLTLCDPTDYTVHGILQARIPE